MSDRPIFDRFPGLRDRVPFTPLATLPTPVEPILGLWVKRDDRTHPQLGGGKVRKLEFFLPRCRTPMLALGPRASNWLLALAHFAPNVRTYTFPQFLNESGLRNVRCFKPARAWPDALQFALGTLVEVPRILGDRLTLAPPGGSDPITCLGWVNAALELAGQIRDRECPKPEAIFVPLGSGGTAAGLALGLWIAGLDTVVYAVRITSRLIANEKRAVSLAVQTAWLLDLKDAGYPRIRVVQGFCGDGYARPTREAVEAKRRFAETGIDLDLTYTAKAAAALMAMKVPNSLLWLTYARPR